MSDDAGGRGRICIDLFCSLDLVAQAPGGPDEDPSGGFAYGGWQAPYGDDEVVGAAIMAGIDRMDALLLGRCTYDLFAGYWPRQQGPIAEVFARVPKYLASRARPDLPWAGSVRLGDDLGAEVAALRSRHREVHVIGSVDLVQTLVAEGLFDVLTLYVYPLLLGRGKRVFRDGTPPAALRLLGDAVTAPSGAVILRYGPGEGAPATGHVGPE